MRWDRLLPIGAALIFIGLLGFLASHLPPWWLPTHALGYCPVAQLGIRGATQCKSYNLYSGSLSDISELTLIFGMITYGVGWWVKHNCHVPGCPRLAWHPHPDHGHPVCKPHHPHRDSDHEVWDIHKEGAA